MWDGISSGRQGLRTRPAVGADWAADLRGETQGQPGERGPMESGDGGFWVSGSGVSGPCDEVPVHKMQAVECRQLDAGNWTRE